MTSALLIIDVQRGLFDDEPRPYQADAVVERINALARRAREARTPVVFIQHERATGSLVYGSPSWQLERNLEVAPTDLHVRMSTPDSFLRTNLHELLVKHQVSTVVICGYACEFCVDTTVRRAAALGFPVTLVRDAPTTHDKPHATAASIRAHENATLPDIGSFGVLIEAIPSGQVSFAA